ncbi:MAG: phosphoribosylglycinamide formyltransferase [Deltaproteobacteria bacterium]|nr:phosphoribosylglycinamide formyltransferase [Deltaproteobacteria bacterium]
MQKKLKIAALISGSGTNLQAVINACIKKEINGKIVCVGADRPNALGLKRAKKHNIPAFITDYKKIIADNNIEKKLPVDFNIKKISSLQKLFDKTNKKIERFFKTRAVAEADILNKLDKFKFNLIILAGFMRKLTPYFIDKINKDSKTPKIMNIHPALLPAFPGTDGYKDAFEYGAKIGGCTVHFVDYGEDTGAIIAQKSFPILDGDTLETIKQKGLKAEWELYTKAIKLFEEGRLTLITKNAAGRGGFKIKREIVKILERMV